MLIVYLCVLRLAPELWKVRVTSVAGFRGPYSMAPGPGLAPGDLLCTLNWGPLRDSPARTGFQRLYTAICHSGIDSLKSSLNKNLSKGL